MPKNLQIFSSINFTFWHGISGHTGGGCCYCKSKPSQLGWTAAVMQSALLEEHSTAQLQMHGAERACCLEAVLRPAKDCSGIASNQHHQNGQQARGAIRSLYRASRWLGLLEAVFLKGWYVRTVRKENGLESFVLTGSLSRKMSKNVSDLFEVLKFTIKIVRKIFENLKNLQFYK